MATTFHRKRSGNGGLSINTERMLIISVSLTLVGILMAVQLSKLGEQVTVAQDLAEELQHDYVARQASVQRYLENRSGADITREGFAQR